MQPVAPHPGHKFHPALFFLVIVTLFAPSSGFGQSDIHGFSKTPITITFNTDDYHGGIQNWDIAQDRRGYIYVANNFGLLEYDGNSWKNYHVENNTRVRSVFVDANNRIYIGGQNQFGYFEADPTGTLVFHSLYDQMEQKDANLEDIWKIQKYENKLLFSSFQGVVAYDGQTVRKLAPDFDHDLVFKIANRLYACSPTDGLALWNGQRFSVIPGSKFLTESQVTAIIPYRNNSLLIFGKNGDIYQYQQDTFSEWRSDAADFLKASLINTAILLQNNNIAIGTQNNGVIILSAEGRVIQHLTKRKGLNNRTVLALHEDLFRNLWVGLNNGISMVELSSPFSLIDEQSGLPGTGYCAAFFDNKLYLGTSNGLFCQESGPNPIAATNNYSLVKNSSGQVYNIQQIGGELFLAHHNGAFQVMDDQALPFYENVGAWKFDNFVGKGRLLAGTYDGFRIFRKTPKGYVLDKRLQSFDESSRVFESVNDSVLFMTHGYKGCYKITLNPEDNTIRQVDFYGKDAGFPSDILINVFDLDNELVFAAERGVYSYDAQQDRFVNNPKLEKYLGASTHVRALENDLAGNIFFMSDTELGYLEQNQFGEYQKHSAAFSRIRRYLSDDLENITVIDHQNVFFGAKEGFVHYNPGVDFVRGQPFRTFIREITSVTDHEDLVYGGTGSLEGRDIAFPASFPSLRIRFAAPWFDGQDELEFQYQLENFDKGWSEWTGVTEKEYTNLSEGTYTFHARARNALNQTSEEASFTFSVYPPWYRSKVAYFLYAASLLMIFGTSILWLDIRHRQERKELTIQQKKELIRKENEIEEVSRKSEAEITRLRNEKLRAEVDHKNRELATNTMHLINKNEFMLSLKVSLQNVIKNGKEPKDSLKRIVREIEKNLSEDDGWDQFTKHFDQVHGEFLKRIKSKHPSLTPQEIKLCAYLRMNMTSKDIANLLNISVRGVEISRYRLRKKLGLDRETNLVDYMLEYT